jgi:hypothetical protein
MRLTLAERFWAKVKKTSNCWLWTGSLSRGYGRVRDRRSGKSVPVHRIAYELLVGPIPDGLTIDHLCRVRCCVNPTHLQPVTNRENILRGNGPAALSARRTSCRICGAFLGDDPYRPGWRRCVPCAVERRQREYAYRRQHRKELRDTAPAEVPLDSPDSVPPGVEALRARHYERINRATQDAIKRARVGVAAPAEEPNGRGEDGPVQPLTGWGYDTETGEEGKP